jgi:hypothetical protein
MADKFEKDLLDLETAFYLQLLPPTNVKERRKTMLSLIVEYSPHGKTVNIIFHGGSSIIKNESFFIMSREGYHKLSEHAAQICHKYIPKSELFENIVRIPVNFDSLYKFVNFFEKDTSNWQLEWITKWELRKVFENHHDLLLNIESRSFTDNELVTFLNDFEKSLKKFYTTF